MLQNPHVVSQEREEESSNLTKKTTILLSILIVLVINNLDVVIGLFSDVDLSSIQIIWIPLSVIAIWIISRYMHIDTSKLGLIEQESKKKTVILGIKLGLLIQLVGFIQTTLFTLLGWYTPNYSNFSTIQGNVGALIKYLTVAWTTAGIGEEIIWRGFMMGQISLLFKDKKKGMVVGLIVSTILFGFTHLYQGVAGVIFQGTAGLLFGIIYIKSDKNLWLTIVVHIFCNTFMFVLIYLL